ncbi:MAG TPA: type II secretion system secretin GspD [Anaeromyxobacteraceae bacterium]
MADGRCQPLQGKFLLAFNKADIVDVLEQASRWTCRNFAYTDDVARGKITLLSKTPVTAEEAYGAFLAALTANNVAIYPSGRYWKLVRIADAKKTPIPIVTDGEAPALEQPVTRVIRLRHGDPDQLRGLLGNYVSPQGADIQSVPPDLLIVTDIGLNVLRIEKLLEAIDRPGGGDLVRFIQVKYAPARDLAEKINQIFQTGPAAPGRPPRRPVIGGVAGTGQAAPVPVAPGGDAAEMSISKVLADERTNKLVVIADERSFGRIQELVAQLDVPTAGDGQIHVVFMKHANAEDLAQTLSALAQGQASTRRPGGPGSPVPQPVPGVAPGATSATLFSGEVKITADKVANALIVLASGSDFATVQRLVEKLDRPRRQVFIEAVILEVDLRNDNQFGVSMHGVLPVSTPAGKGFIPLGSETGRLNSLDVTSLVKLGGFLTGLVGPVSAELKDLFPVSSLSVLLQALQTSSDVNVLSTPHLLASDNEDAEIAVGQNVPFQSGFMPPSLGGLGLGTGAATTTGTTAATVGGLLGGTGSLLGLGSLFAPIQRQNVELRLKVKPQINEGESVTLQLDEQTEEIVDKDPQLGPTTAKRSVKTKVTVKDQTTIVIGGLIQDRTVTSVHKTPLLGDVPVLGWLFRDQTTTKTKTNLLLFLTPYIIRDQEDYRRILERKRLQQREFVEEIYGPTPDYKVSVDYERKGGPYSRLRRDVEVETLKLENDGPGAPGEGAVGPGGRIQPRPPPPAGARPGGPSAPLVVPPPARPPAAAPPPGPPPATAPGAVPPPSSAGPAAAPGEPAPAPVR